MRQTVRHLHRHLFCEVIVVVVVATLFALRLALTANVIIIMIGTSKAPIWHDLFALKFALTFLLFRVGADSLLVLLVGVSPLFLLLLVLLPCTICRFFGSFLLTRLLLILLLLILIINSALFLSFFVDLLLLWLTLLLLFPAAGLCIFCAAVHGHVHVHLHLLCWRCSAAAAAAPRNLWIYNQVVLRINTDVASHNVIETHLAGPLLRRSCCGACSFAGGGGANRGRRGSGSGRSRSDCGGNLLSRCGRILHQTAGRRFAGGSSGESTDNCGILCCRHRWSSRGSTDNCGLLCCRRRCFRRRGRCST
mmetsp:Transcript_21669/g.47182  ORF Transcript_21669/g.47182 Transcript_21669/m.47182 type:complete len:307 (+) Transcript_21669:544-1464(+)